MRQLTSDTILEPVKKITKATVLMVAVSKAPHDDATKEALHHVSELISGYCDEITEGRRLILKEFDRIARELVRADDIYKGMELKIGDLEKELLKYKEAGHEKA